MSAYLEHDTLEFSELVRRSILLDSAIHLLEDTLADIENSRLAGESEEAAEQNIKGFLKGLVR